MSQGFHLTPHLSTPFVRVLFLILQFVTIPAAQVVAELAEPTLNASKLQIALLMVLVHVPVVTTAWLQVLARHVQPMLIV